jgi:hypothetical protein
MFILCSGYIAWKGEKEENREETPVKKYQRLNCEVRHFLCLSFLSKLLEISFPDPLVIDPVPDRSLFS